MSSHYGFKNMKEGLPSGAGIDRPRNCGMGHEQTTSVTDLQPSKTRTARREFYPKTEPQKHRPNVYLRLIKTTWGSFGGCMEVLGRNVARGWGGRERGDNGVLGDQKVVCHSVKGGKGGVLFEDG